MPSTLFTDSCLAAAVVVYFYELGTKYFQVESQSLLPTPCVLPLRSVSRNGSEQSVWAACFHT